MHARERLIVEELPGERFVAVREPAPELEFRGCGPARGVWEDQHPANDVEDDLPLPWER